MTIKEVIAAADALRPGNRFSAGDKYRWLNQCETAIQREVLLMKEPTEPYVQGQDDDESLLAPPPYDELYIQWLCAKIDQAQAQYEIYTNTIEQYNRTVREFAAWVIKSFDPKRNPVGVEYDVPVIIRGTEIALHIGGLPLKSAECAAGTVTLTQGETELVFTAVGDAVTSGTQYVDSKIIVVLSKSQTLGFAAGSVFITWRLTDKSGNVYTPGKMLRIKLKNPDAGIVTTETET